MSGFLLKPSSAMAAFLACAVSLHAEITQARISVYGMTCSACAYGCEKRLQYVSGVEAIDIDLKGASASLTSKKGSSLDVSQIRDAIKKAGYTPGPIQFTAIGTIRQGAAQHLELQSRGDGKVFTLSHLEGSTAELLTQAAQSGTPVEVVAVIQEPMKDMNALSVRAAKHA